MTLMLNMSVASMPALNVSDSAFTGPINASPTTKVANAFLMLLTKRPPSSKHFPQLGPTGTGRSVSDVMPPRCGAHITGHVTAATRSAMNSRRFMAAPQDTAW
jgi:hypothetical protein